MHEILKSLHEDHVNLMRLLTLVRRGLRDEPTHDGDVDYNLILDVLDYIENYADAIHHMRERIKIYARLTRSTPGSRRPGGALYSSEHQHSERIDGKRNSIPVRTCSMM